MTQFKTADGKKFNVVAEDPYPETVDLKKASKETVERLTSPTIASQFPLAFANGTVIHSPPIFICPQCRTQMCNDQVHATLSRWPESVITIRAAGVCLQCKIIVPFEFRINDNMELASFYNGKWAIVSLAPQSASLLEKVKNSINALKESLYAWKKLP